MAKEDINKSNLEEAKVIFCTTYKGLTVTITPAGLVDKQGNKIPPKYAVFRPSQYGCSYETADANEIEILKKNYDFKSGKIFIINPKNASVSIAPVRQTVTGQVSSVNTVKK